MDYMHVIDWKKAEQLANGGKAETINGFKVIRLATILEAKALSFIPEPKSPHGCDVSPDGEFVIVSGKLDPHVTIYSTAKIKEALASGKYASKDEYGVPVINFDDVKEAQVEVGLGPLHTQFDDKGYAYTSLFLDSAICRWSMGGNFAKLHPEKPWTVVAKAPMQYNIGHLVVAGGDTEHPYSKYMIGMNKWSVDRFFQTGPLLPQNFQLVDISETGDKMPVLYDMPIGVGEPHYAQIIKADTLKPLAVYEVGTDPKTMSVDPKAPMPGDEKVVRESDGKVHVYGTLVRSHINPENIEVEEGDTIVFHLTNVEQTPDATHGFCIGGYNISLSMEPGEYETFELKADRSGTYPYYCTEFCSALHLEMMGYLQVKPKSTAVAK
jgi:nitrous-oxide reductase